jgi:hypothetical protein
MQAENLNTMFGRALVTPINIRGSMVKIELAKK